VIVEDAHLDGFGHTNNIVYLAWIQDVAWSHSIALGWDMAAYRRIGAGFVARRHELDYLAATFAGDRLQVATWITANGGRADMWRAYQIVRTRDGATVLRGKTQWVCIDMASGRPRRQPPEFVAAYEPLAATPGRA
jgi:acyl-CoA thioester hydrolase